MGVDDLAWMLVFLFYLFLFLSASLRQPESEFVGRITRREPSLSLSLLLLVNCNVFNLK
jgi:hypothetical protein